MNSPFAIDVLSPLGSTNHANAPDGEKRPPTPKSPKEGATVARAVVTLRVSFNPRVLLPITPKEATPNDIAGYALYVTDTMIPNVAPPPPRTCHACHTLRQVGQSRSVSPAIMTHRPKQFRVRALADGLEPAVRRNNIHLEKIVDAKSETGSQIGVTATLRISKMFRLPIERPCGRRCTTHQHPTSRSSHLWCTTNQCDILRLGKRISLAP